MDTEASMSSAVGKLREVLAKIKAGDEESAEMLNARDVVLARFGQSFRPDNIHELTKQEFKDFLLFKNNRHWQGLHRLGGIITSDMEVLRQALTILLDETIPIKKRLDKLVPMDKQNYVKGLAKAILTPILMIVYPQSYTVWNSVVEGAMRTLDIWPEFSHGMTFGERYELLNSIQMKIAGELNVDYWTLDALWWRVQQPPDGPDGPPVDDMEEDFRLEKYLHEFMVDNWERMQLGKEWMIFEEDGDPLAGYKYQCDAGEIDILAKHRHKNEWLIIELKRSQTSDATIGQALRYIGWVREKLAKPNDIVKGLIIARGFDKPMWYALKAVDGIQLQRYEVKFNLLAANPINEDA